MITKGYLMEKGKFRWWKFIALWVGFLLLHYSYKWFPNPVFFILSGESETVFLHMKMLFVDYVFINLVEFYLVRNRIQSKGSRLANRALIAVVYPWATITFWLLAWAFHIEFSIFWTIVYSNVTMLLGFYLALRMEDLFENIEFSSAIKWIILMVFTAAVIVYVSFTLNPIYPFFTPPPGW